MAAYVEVLFWAVSKPGSSVTEGQDNKLYSPVSGLSVCLKVRWQMLSALSTRGCTAWPTFASGMSSVGVAAQDMLNWHSLSVNMNAPITVKKP